MILSVKTNYGRILCIMVKYACPKINNMLVPLIIQTIHLNHNVNCHILYCVWLPADNST